jgi:hypothetical protein
MLQAISLWRAEGHTLATLSRKFRHSRFALRRHFLHIEDQKAIGVSTVPPDAPTDSSDCDLVAKLHRVELSFDEIEKEAIRRSDSRLRLMVGERKMKAIELEARLSNQLDRNTPGNVTVNQVNVISGDDPRERILRKLQLSELVQLPAAPIEGETA